MALFQGKFSKQEVSSLFSVLDVGSSKICCAIGQKNNVEQGKTVATKIRVLGMGQQASKGMRKGNLVDIYDLENAILNAVHSAEQSANTSINKVFVGISSSAIKVNFIYNKINVAGRPIDDQHLKKILKISRESFLDAEHQIIHVFPLSYALDKAERIVDPRGMIGNELTCTFCILSAPITLIKNLSHCLERCHLDVAGFVSTGYATGLSTLVEDERSLGVSIIDIGGDSTTLSSFVGDCLVNTVSFPVGGNHITNDIARVLSTPLSQAERLKNLYGTLLKISNSDHETIVIPQLGEVNDGAHGNSVSKFYLSEIIRCRVEEIFKFVHDYAKKSPLDSVVYQRYVLSGGTSQLSGIREFASEYFNVQVRLGNPFDIVGANDIVQTPVFATSAGLMRFAIQEYFNQLQLSFANKNETRFQKVTNWIRENF